MIFWYRNSILASICSIIGCGMVILAIVFLIEEGASDLLLTIIFFLAGIGLIVLGSMISSKKAQKEAAAAAGSADAAAALARREKAAKAGRTAWIGIIVAVIAFAAAYTVTGIILPAFNKDSGPTNNVPGTSEQGSAPTESSEVDDPTETVAEFPSVSCGGSYDGHTLKYGFMSIALEGYTVYDHSDDNGSYSYLLSDSNMVYVSVHQQFESGINIRETSADSMKDSFRRHHLLWKDIQMNDFVQGTIGGLPYLIYSISSIDEDGDMNYVSELILANKEEKASFSQRIYLTGWDKAEYDTAYAALKAVAYDENIPTSETNGGELGVDGIADLTGNQ